MWVTIRRKRLLELSRKRSWICASLPDLNATFRGMLDALLPGLAFLPRFGVFDAGRYQGERSGAGLAGGTSFWPARAQTRRLTHDGPETLAWITCRRFNIDDTLILRSAQPRGR